MAGPELLRQAIDVARSSMASIPESQQKEMGLFIKDLEESTLTLFVRTAEARPMIARCVRAAEALKKAIETGGWTGEATAAFEEFERGVSKLRSTIMVRTQRAT